jgi:A/G-specific adenine glycosylase
LYDYGTLLKAQLGKKKSDLHKKSKGYVKQSKFDGSDRQIRGQILKVLLELKSAYIKELQVKSTILGRTETKKIQSILQRLSDEGFIKIKKKGTEFAIL